MKWTIRYSAFADGDLSVDRRAALDVELANAASLVPGRLIREAGELDGALFAGSLSPQGRRTHQDVQDLLAFLGGLERSYQLSVRVEDNLRLVRRDPESGELELDLEGRSVLRSVPDLPALHGLEMPEQAESSVDDFRDMIDALTRSEMPEDDEVYAGADPAMVPFADLSPLVELGPAVELPTRIEAGPGPWRLTGLRVVRRADPRSGVTGFYVAGELELAEGLRAHLVSIDLVLRDSNGDVLGTEDCFAGYDVRRRCELEAEALMAHSRAWEVARIDIGVDAYLRRDVKLATGRPSGGTLLEPQKDYPLRVTIRQTDWPDHGWTATGEVHNEGGRFLANVGLSLAVYDADGGLVSDDEVEICMIAPGGARAFELIALMDEDDEPRLAVVRGRFVTRSRELACIAILQDPEDEPG